MTSCTSSLPAKERWPRNRPAHYMFARSLRMARVMTRLAALAAFAWFASAAAPSGVAEARSLGTAHSVNAGRQVEP